MNGFELTKRLRADSANRSTHLIALTGYGQAAERQKAPESELDKHLVEPLQPDSLMRLLRGEGTAQA